nr:MAG: putative coat protein [Leviviridae sp.]
MLGDTITITHNAVSRVLSKINQDNYSGEYLLRTATDEFRVRVRHSVDNAPKGTVAFDRHNIDLSVTTFATPTTVEEVQTANYTVRTRKSSNPANALLAAKALNGWLTDANVTKLIAWES